MPIVHNDKSLPVLPHIAVMPWTFAVASLYDKYAFYVRAIRDNLPKPSHVRLAHLPPQKRLNNRCRHRRTISPMYRRILLYPRDAPLWARASYLNFVSGPYDLFANARSCLDTITHLALCHRLRTAQSENVVLTSACSCSIAYTTRSSIDNVIYHISGESPSDRSWPTRHHDEQNHLSYEGLFHPRANTHQCLINPLCMQHHSLPGTLS